MLSVTRAITSLPFHLALYSLSSITSLPDHNRSIPYMPMYPRPVINKAEGMFILIRLPVCLLIAVYKAASTCDAVMYSTDLYTAYYQADRSYNNTGLLS